MIEDLLKKIGIDLPEQPKALGSYRPCVISGDMVYVSGQLPIKNGQLAFQGKLGDELSTEQGKEAARVAVINCISVLKHELGQLDRIKKIVKVTGYISSSEGFTDQADVLNGASDLLFDVFGDKGIHARAAVGVYELPKGSPVEIELIAETES